MQHATEDSARYKGFEITDTDKSVFFHSIIDEEACFGIELYKDDSEERVLEDIIADYTYYAPEAEKQRVHLLVRSSGLTRRFEDTASEDAMRQAISGTGKAIVRADEEAVSQEEFADRLREIAPDLEKVSQKRQEQRVEAEAFEEMTGTDKVSEESAQKLLKALRIIQARLSE